MLWMVVVVLSGVATALAWHLARERPDHRPVAALLTLGFISDLARQALRIAVFLPARERFAGAPYTGWTRVAADADNALALAYPAAIVAGALWVFLRRRSLLGNRRRRAGGGLSANARRRLEPLLPRGGADRHRGDPGRSGHVALAP